MSVFPKHAKKVFQGYIFSTWQWDQKLYDGSVAVFEGINRPDASQAVGVLGADTIILVEDEQPHRNTVLTPAGGVVEENETPEQAVIREFAEETGYTPGKLTPWFSYAPYSKMAAITHLFIAKDLGNQAEAKLDAGERITVREYTFEDFLELGHDPKLRDIEMRIRLLETKIDSSKRKELYDLLFS